MLIKVFVFLLFRIEPLSPLFMLQAQKDHSHKEIERFLYIPGRFYWEDLVSMRKAMLFLERQVREESSLQRKKHKIVNLSRKITFYIVLYLFCKLILRTDSQHLSDCPFEKTNYTDQSFIVFLFAKSAIC